VRKHFPDSIAVYWDEITRDSPFEARVTIEDILVRQYSKKNRHYHNLEHLEELFKLMETYPIEDETRRKEVIGAIFWHDAVYRTDRNIFFPRKSNEERSAEMADLHMRQLGFGAYCREQIKKYIRHTQTHSWHNFLSNPEGAAFLDMDMAILGSDPERYVLYTQKVRDEYMGYSDLEFDMARLEKFIIPTLQKERIFLTDEFNEKFEDRARENLACEKAWIEHRLARHHSLAL